MATIRCSVVSCHFQKDDRCTLDSIKIVESPTGNMFETDCSSYESKNSFPSDDEFKAGLCEDQYK